MGEGVSTITKGGRQRSSSIESRVSGKVHLQGIGKQPGVKAGDLAVGDTTLWNYGYSDKIAKISKKSAKFIVVTFKDGGSRTLRTDRLVAVVTKDNKVYDKGKWR